MRAPPDQTRRARAGRKQLSLGQRTGISAPAASCRRPAGCRSSARPAPRRGRRARAARSRRRRAAPPTPSSRTSMQRVPVLALHADGHHGRAARTWRRWSAPRRRRSRPPPRPGRAAAPRARSRRSTGSGARVASDSTAGSSPRSVSTAGWMPRASSRSSSSATSAPRRRARGRASSRVAARRQPQHQRERHEPLLRAVVQVALQPPALGVARRDDAGARGGELRARLRVGQRLRGQLGEVRDPLLGAGAGTARARRWRRSPRPTAAPSRKIGAATAERNPSPRSVARELARRSRVVVDPRRRAGAVDARRRRCRRPSAPSSPTGTLRTRARSSRRRRVAVRRR